MKLFDLRRRVRELEERLARVYERTPALVTEAQQKRANLERLMVLAGLGEKDRLWQTVLSYADEHARNLRMEALGHGLADGERQFAAGRASGAEDFCCALRDLRLAAEKEAAKIKRE